MATNRVALILGAGPRIGASVAERFANDGYNIAVASRNGTGSKNSKGFLTLKADFTIPESIPALFEAVKKEFHSLPGVVIYNAASFTMPQDQTSVLSVPADKVLSDLNVNITLPAEMKKTFIYTGNILNTVVLPIPMFLTGGMGKSATAHWIGVADTLYAARGFRFFYADERFADGKLKGGSIDGPAHAEFYARLAKQDGNVPWHATFVKDTGYAKF
ncbi:hypothetical protein P154DRAFT_552126 [Amniculicola lignicola CBS 123094]|uniref:NAD(P)-binding protein n=1 Tax=Amniculicola lignicola CBS 123094 TaxID=1392246 RepID=A0A6A5WQX1_9PLEO|nr:hypothetical protein P154DRAFT_552126 [Amniculicola lignicola CBS 123094]